jgi:hypothetical protein
MTNEGAGFLHSAEIKNRLQFGFNPIKIVVYKNAALQIAGACLVSAPRWAVKGVIARCIERESACFGFFRNSMLPRADRRTSVSYNKAPNIG